MEIVQIRWWYLYTWFIKMIVAYTGLPGTGKTLNMVRDVLPFLKKRTRVISNTPIRLKIKKDEVYEAEFIQKSSDFELKLWNEQNCLFVIDEASVFLSNYNWNKLDPAYLMKFAQTRKYHCDIFYTTQRFSHTLKRLRDLTNYVVVCENHIPFGIESFQFFTARTMNPEYFDQKNYSREWEKRNLIRTQYLFPVKARSVFKAYFTEFIVNVNPIMASMTKNRVQLSQTPVFNDNDNSLDNDDTPDIPNWSFS